MKKFQLLGVALVALFAFSVVLSASASAATFLLAEWLVNGAAITEAGPEVNTEAVGTILLEDTKTALGASSVICSGTLLGTIGFDGLGRISEVLTLGGVVVGSANNLTGEALSCEEVKVCEEALVWPLHLPWNTLLELMEDGTEIFFVVLIENGGSGAPGWEVECMKTITKPVDECTATTTEEEGMFNLTLEATLLLATFSDTFAELAGVKLATCTQSKEATGIVESIPQELKLSAGGTVNASSESVEA